MHGRVTGSQGPATLQPGNLWEHRLPGIGRSPSIVPKSGQKADPGLLLQLLHSSLGRYLNPVEHLNPHRFSPATPSPGQGCKTNIYIAAMSILDSFSIHPLREVGWWHAAPGPRIDASIWSRYCCPLLNHQQNPGAAQMLCDPDSKSLHLSFPEVFPESKCVMVSTSPTCVQRSVRLGRYAQAIGPLTTVLVQPTTHLVSRSAEGHVAQATTWRSICV